MDQEYLVLAINPGSTSTKIAVYKNLLLVYGETISHSIDELSKFETIEEQYSFRKQAIVETVEKAGISLKEIAAVVGRGGLLKPLQGGTYNINQIMLEDLKKGIRGNHASNLGAPLAYEIAKAVDIPSFIVDPVVVDEMIEVAKITGLPEFKRRSLFHALNQKAIARRAARDLGKEIEDCNLIVAHLGGGISIGAHLQGRVVDVNNALDGEGPFSPERSGTLPIGDVVRMCFSGETSYEDLQKKLVGRGGLVAYFGTSDVRQVENLIKSGDKTASLVMNALAFQVAKNIGASATVLKGEVDAIVLTGGMAYVERLVKDIEARIRFISKVLIYPGEDEMLALTEGTLRVLMGQELAKNYC